MKKFNSYIISNLYLSYQLINTLMFDQQDKNLNKSVPGMLYRQHFKMNATENEDENIKRIAAALGITEDQFRLEIKIGQERNRAEYLAVQDFTASYKALFDNSPKTSKDKYEELMDVGRFLLTELNVQLNVPSKMLEYPDFTIQMGNELIGNEHSRVIDEKMKLTTQTTQKLIQDAATIVAQTDPDLNGIVNLFVDFDCPVIGDKFELKGVHKYGALTSKRNRSRLRI